MRYVFAPLALVLCSCGDGGNLGSGHIVGIGIAIVGPTMIDSRGPIENAVIIIAGSKIQAAGTASQIPVPASIERVEAAGKFVIPALVREGDTNPFDELDSLVKNGMLPRYALATVTAMKAAKLNLENLGTIEKGKTASLLILSADPLKDVANFRKIDRAMINGRWGDVSKPYAN